MRCTIAALAAATLISRAAWAVDPFEIQVYDGTANPQGVPGIELHTNAVVKGLTDSTNSELPQNHQLHFTLEPSYGVTSWWEIGGYFQTAVADGSFDYAGVKLRSKFVTPPSFHPHLRLGLNLELSLLPTTYDVNEWATEARPIIAFENRYVLLAANPIISTPLAGPYFRQGPTFEPAAMALYKIQERAAIGLEYYGDIGPISNPDPVSEQGHYVFEVMQVLAIPNVELSIGFGEGLTSGSNRFVAKLIVGYTFEQLKKKPRASAE